MTQAGNGEDPELKDLRFNWGDAYEIGADPEAGYWALRRDGLGTDITARDPGTLRNMIWADYSAKPVPRELTPAEGS